MSSETDEEQNVQTTNPPLAGQVFDDGKGRVFPCDRCGANLVFSIGQQSLQCSYCGTLKQIAPPPDVPIVERDFLEMLDRLKRLRQSGQVESQTSEAEHAIRCLDCGAEVIFQGTLTSSHCPYCAAPLQRDQIHNSPQGIPVDGMLPFLVPPEHAAENLRQWVRSLWWAPNQFLREGANGKFNGVYLPFFTYDALTWTRYSGERGDAYTVTVGSGNSERRERRVRWYPAGGEFQRFFDDVLIIAAGRQQSSLVHQMEPWPLEQLIAYTPELLAGFYSRTYDIELEEGFTEARQRIDFALTQDVKQRIGGDEQRIAGMNCNYSALTYKHLLLPVWLLAYRYHNRTYQVMINGATGQVAGQRPYSWFKIGFVAVVVAIVVVIFWSSH